jgi:S-phase kinase-associated protein 1
VGSMDKPSENDLKAWDADFVKVDQATLFDLILVRFIFFFFSFDLVFVESFIGIFYLCLLSNI